MTETLFAGAFLSARWREDGIVDIRLDRQNDSLNKLDHGLIGEIDQLLPKLRSQAGLRGVLLASGKDAFLAGADIQLLAAMFAQGKAEHLAFCTRMDQVLTALEDLPVPVVAAINGYALGGGLEVALCSDYRVLASNGQIGFPEVGLGILPGAGGCVRTPRLAGISMALEWIVSARSFKADAALRAGMVDALAEPAALDATALDLLREAIDGRRDWRARRAQRQGSFTLDKTAMSAARAQAQKAARHYPAGLAVIDLLASSAALSRDAAFALEAQTFAALMQTPTAQAMVGIFLSNQQLKKKTRAQSDQARKPQRAAVLGAGIMGGGIAYTTAIKGMPVLLKDIAQPALDLGIGEARKLLAKQVEGGRLQKAQADAVLASITPMLEFQQFDSVEVVVEAVVENLKVKQDVLRQVESLVKPGTVLASNTSSLSIAEIAAPLARPQDVVGMHFFNPVPLMPLVEVVRGPQTSDSAIATTVAYAVAMGKTPLVVKDCPGFLINRLLGAYFGSFMQLIRDGADFVQVDRVMESWGWPMGPAYLLDVAGLDTLDKAMAILGKAYPDVMASSETTIIQRLAAEKRYGQKTGAGFYRYEADAKGKPHRSGDPSVAALIASVQRAHPRAIGDEEILERMMLAMLLEAGRCLDEQVVDSALEIDAGMRLGTGFPAHHGGPLWYADRLGLAQVLERCEHYRELGGLFVAGAGLRERAQASRRYY